MQHTHLVVDGGVDHDPGAAPEFCVGGYVDEDWLGAGAQLVHDVGAELEHLVEHVLHAAREAAPVGEHHDGQALVAEVLDGLCRLVRRVRVPHLARLRNHLPKQHNKTFRVV